MGVSIVMAMTDWDACGQRLSAGMDALGISGPAAVRDRLIAYLRELTTWNATYNLTAVRDPEAMVTRHLLDCLAVSDFVVGANLADVGAGPGLPGLVLAIARPRLAVTLVESNRKKAAFLRHARRQLALDNVEVAQARVEAFKPAKKFDCVITRAFASAGDTARGAGHLIAPGGRFVLMKGRDPAAEMEDLPLDFRHLATHAVTVPGLGAERHVAILEPGLI
ncbi:16S rRNA (guanine(527)-N(7))-methyltransferase RsmG [Salinisphaera sp.]|uniref:16S rRNA (guanine(527)-N(7))-methyltransferase RsmG n=1 Tax=Salinisphaera sp. TaxID=1914330 RepID=UPI002D7880BF|nr:16S rRNA (guanine(527)-N(7))-methyltransferase RsmG [Salinisphaera sp.]HET7313570.1 16S rRNA (guanine(527)-N(7))-methyltransferase RsmG [Salinisphaera sp.]